MSSTEKERVYIAGTGIIGACTAYYLTQRNVPVTLIDKVEPAAAASGRAGGFLAADWNSGAVGRLAQLSFNLHQDLANTLGAQKIDYRRVGTLGLAFNARGKRGKARVTPDWIDGNITQEQVIGDHETCAQVHPRKLVNALVEKCKEQGAEIVTGGVEGVQLAQNGQGPEVEGVIIDGKTVPCKKLVIAMGPWSQLASKWLPGPQVQGLKAHSIVVKPTKDITDHILFTNVRDPSGNSANPEVYARPDNTAYVCGVSEGNPPVPENPKDVFVDDSIANKIHTNSQYISSALGDGEILKRQACYLPALDDSVPVIGKLEPVNGAYIGTGHTCWGILNGPATGYVLAELIDEGRCKTLDLRAFSSTRLPVSKSWKQNVQQRV